MLEYIDVLSEKDLPDALINAEQQIFGSYQSCPKNRKGQEGIYPYPGKLFVVTNGTAIDSFLYSCKISSNADYIWACGTLPGKRGLGYFTEIMNHYLSCITSNYAIIFVSDSNILLNLFISLGCYEIDYVDSELLESLCKTNIRLRGCSLGEELKDYYRLSTGESVDAYLYGIRKAEDDCEDY